MSGTPRPDPAFLHNVPTSLPSTVSPLTSQLSTTAASSTISSILSSSTLSSTSSLAATATPTPTVNPVQTSLYFYDPSIPFAIAFSVLYAVLIPYHFYHSIYIPHIAKSVSRKHRYTIPLLIACILSTLGFSLRIASASTPSSIALYATSLTSIVVSPIFVCATLYLTVTHLINLCLPSGPGRTFLRISPRWLGRVFIASDVLSFLCQGAGSSIAASGNWEGSEKDTGTAILIFGLVAQLVTFTVYLAVFTLFCLKVRSGRAEEKRAEVQVVGVDVDTNANHGMVEEKSSRDFGFNPLVKQVVRGLWTASVCVEVRSVYRVIEFATRVDGYLFKHEWALWVFEAAPMWAALLALGYFHPVKWLQQKRRSAFVDKHDGNFGDRLPR